MKNFSSKIFGFTVFAMFLICFSFTAHAVPDVPPTGTVHVFGDVIITLTDESGGAASNDIAVMLTDIAAGYNYRILFSGEEYAGGSMVFYGTLIANTTYTVAFTYTGNNDLLFVFDAQTNEPVERFHLTAGGVELNWVLRLVQDVPSTEIDINEVVDVFAVIEDMPFDDVYAEAAMLWERFVDSVSHMNGNSSYDRFLRGGGDIIDARRAERFTAITGGTADDWNSMSLFERFLWHDGYVGIAYTFLNTDFEMSFGSWSSYRLNFGHVFTGLRRYPEAIEAFEDLIRWQYDYILANHTVYNFITGTTLRDFLLETGQIITDPIEESTERSYREDILYNEEINEILTEIQDYIPELLSEANSPVRADEPTGIPFTIIIVVVVLAVIVFIGFVISKKKST